MLWDLHIYAFRPQDRGSSLIDFQKPRVLIHCEAHILNKIMDNNNSSEYLL